MSTGKIQFAEQDGTFVLKFVGEIRLTLCSALDATIEKIFSALNFSAIVIDLTETRSIDSTTLGLLAKLSILSRQKVGLLPTVVTTHPDITRLLQSMGFDQVFNIVGKPLPGMPGRPASAGPDRGRGTHQGAGSTPHPDGAQRVQSRSLPRSGERPRAQLIVFPLIGPARAARLRARFRRGP